MSNSENPINAPVREWKYHRPREGEEARVSRTISIDARTNRVLDLNLARLRKLEPTAAPGRVIDRMAVFCAAYGFDVCNPEKRLPAEKKSATASTPPPTKPAKAKKA